MYRLNQPKPDIRFNRNGRIDIIDQVVQRMNLGHQNRVSFYVDQESKSRMLYSHFPTCPKD